MPAGRVVFRVAELYREEEVSFSLPYRRLLGVIRLAQVIEDQLVLGAVVAALLSAKLLAPRPNADHPASD
jgi:hypothetical protein